MRSPVFVKLNALESLGGGAFTFSIFYQQKLTANFVRHIDLFIWKGYLNEINIKL
jgi:hypothetical protein